MVLQHHKNERNYHYAPIQFDLPPALNLMVVRHVQLAHPLLAQAGERVLWVNSKGKGMSQSQLSIWFNTLLLHHAAPFATFPPRSLRHIFVGDRGANEGVPGPDARGAASVMGNSPTAWRKYYDLHITGREVEQAVQGMEQWRQATLAGAPMAPEALEDRVVHVPQMQGPFKGKKRGKVLMSSSEESGSEEGEQFFDCQ